MTTILGLLYLGFAFLKKNANKFMHLLLWLQIVTYIMHMFVGNNVSSFSVKTLFNVIFVNTCLMLIIYPWGNGRIQDVTIKNLSFLLFYKKALYFFLKANFVIFLLIAVVVWVFIPDIVALKRDKAFHDLYLQIPYFSILYRYASITKFLGILALPFFAFYLKKNRLIEARNALILSFSVFIIGIATYNRAVMITYILLCISVYLFIASGMPIKSKKTIEKYLKRVIAIVLGFMVFITIGRFTSSSMDYYGDQIPKNSIIKEPSTYSLFNYASQGYVNGINFLELYNGENRIAGKGITYDFMQALAFFDIINWDSESYFKITDKVYNINGLSDNNKSDNFHGYAADMVANFGYILSLFFSLLYFFYVRFSLQNYKPSIIRLSILTLLMVIPLNSIFYMSYSMLVFPVLFLIIVKSIYILLSYGK